MPDLTTPPSNYGDPDPNYYSVAHAQLLSSYTDLLQKVKDQNAKLDDQIKQNSQEHSTDYQRSYYERESAEYLRTIYSYMFYLYMLFVVIIIVLLIFTKKITQPRMIVLVLLLIGFPFLIFPLENLLYSTVMWIYSFVMDKVFTNPYLSATAV